MTQVDRNVIAAEKIRAALQNRTNQSQKKLLKTLLGDFGFKVRSPKRLEEITQQLANLGVNLSPPLTDCKTEGWVNLSLVETVSEPPGIPTEVGFPIDEWFDSVRKKQFRTEKEVEIRFIVPLLDRLGYSEDDRADGYSIKSSVGVSKKPIVADFVLFDELGPDRGKALLVVEAKRPGAKLSIHTGQAKSYAMFLGCPYYMITNGDDLKVLRCNNHHIPDKAIFRCDRATLKESFPELLSLIGRDALLQNRDTFKAPTDQT